MNIEQHCVTLHLEFAPHAALLSRYDMTEKRYVKVGQHAGVYGPETSAGAAYVCTGTERNGRITHSTGVMCGAFYPSTLFLIGEDAEGESMHHAPLEVVARRIFNDPSRIKRVVMPRGYVKGRMTWWHAIKFVRAGEWWHTRRRDLTSIFPEPTCYLIPRFGDMTCENETVEIGDLRQITGAGEPANVKWLEFAPKAGEFIRNKETGKVIGVSAVLDGNLVLDASGDVVIIWRFQDGLNNQHTWESKEGAQEAP